MKPSVAWRLLYGGEKRSFRARRNGPGSGDRCSNKSKKLGKGRIIEGDVEIVGPWDTEQQPEANYRVSKIHLYRGQEMPESARRQR